MAKILIIEDEEAIRNVLKNILLEENKDYVVELAVNGNEGLSKIIIEEYDLVLCDIKMPKMDGIEVLEKTMKYNANLPFIMISGHGDIDVAVKSIKLGAFDYISKPPDLNVLLNTVRNALDKKSLVVEKNNLENENKLLRKKLNDRYKMIGESKPLIAIREMINKVADTDARVLIMGSNGTGKELVAHQIHEKSQRADSPMVEVNCAAIPSELIESELFGHIKGSFTGAYKDKKGKIELADNGTLFLDEIGDMSLSAQAKVLRVLQEGKIARVGGDKEIDVNVRVIAATNKDLKSEIEKGNFREDLYHRLAVILIKVPSLNDRIADLPELVNHFSKNISEHQGLLSKEFDKEAIEELKKIDWTGNIRELRNVVERLLILSDDKVKKQDVISFAKK
jgi:two-component system nitrogen regulation response regulator NtrX